jgi:hypothetical protein
VTLEEAIELMTEALAPLTLEVPGLQITGYFNPNPTPPSIDIYADDPFQVGAGFGVGSKSVAWAVRCRVSTADPASASRTLLRFMDTNDPASVEAALVNAEAFIGNEGTVSGFTRFSDDPTPDILGCRFRVEMFV